MLQAPPTIRLPRPDELPNNPEVFERLKGRENAKIVEGFVFKHNTSHDLLFKFYAEININNFRLWSLFKTLSTHLPNEVSCIYNLYDEKPIYSPYLKKTIVLQLLDNYELEFTQDCNLEMGIMFQSEEKLIEVFISDSKFIKYWGSNENDFRLVMHDFGLNEIPDMNFIDQFPKVVEPLTMINNNAKETEMVINKLRENLG
jgi:hypothetical protein